MTKFNASIAAAAAALLLSGNAFAASLQPAAGEGPFFNEQPLFAALSLRLAPTAGGLFQTFALLTLAVASLLVAVLTLATVKGLREGSWLGPETVAALQVASER